eukprot:1641987-Pyramimonas_sp.AAC.1
MVLRCVGCWGAGLLPRIKRELAQCLEEGGFESVAEAVGADHRQRGQPLPPPSSSSSTSSLPKRKGWWRSW